MSDATNAAVTAAAADSTKDSAAAAPAQGAAPEGTKAAAPAAPAKKAPEKYEFKFAEGATLDAEVLKEFEANARELDLDQASAQKIADLGAKMSAKLQSDLKSKVETAQKEWAAAAKADPEFGGENLEANLGIAQKAIATFASEPLKALLRDTGLGNNPEVIRLFWKVGQAISEDKLVTGGKAPASDGGLFLKYDKSDHK